MMNHARVLTFPVDGGGMPDLIDALDEATTPVAFSAWKNMDPG